MAQTSSVHFDNPPVVETVLGVQFNHLTNFTNGHLGWYWKQYLSKDWPKAVDAPALPDHHEAFDPENQWIQLGWQLSLESGIKPARLRISNKDGDRLIQVQATRFHYNWQKREGVYPSYKKMRAEFDVLFADFCRFVAETPELGELIPNQWEVIYVDHIPRGVLWNSPADWHKVFPALFKPAWNPRSAHLENLQSEWHYEIEPRRGRLHIGVQQVRVGSKTGPEVLQLQTTARGAVRNEQGWDLDAGLRLGHEITLDAFLEMASPEAQRVWRGRE